MLLEHFYCELGMLNCLMSDEAGNNRILNRKYVTMAKAFNGVYVYSSCGVY